MNCAQLQENLFDYLDDTLSPGDKAAIDSHLVQCSICSQAVQREQLLAETLCQQLEHIVEPVVLGVDDQRVMARAVHRRVAKSREHAGFSFWKRLALPVAGAALVLTGAFWTGHRVVFDRRPDSKTSLSLAARESAAHIDLSYSVLDYAFHKEGTMVVDALTYQTCVVDAALLARK